MHRASAARAGEATQLLRATRDGDAGAIDRIMPLVYDDLRRLARWQIPRSVGPRAIRPTELAHDAYVKLAGAGAHVRRDESRPTRTRTASPRRFLPGRPSPPFGNGLLVAPFASGRRAICARPFGFRWAFGTP